MEKSKIYYTDTALLLPVEIKLFQLVVVEIFN